MTLSTQKHTAAYAQLLPYMPQVHGCFAISQLCISGRHFALLCSTFLLIFVIIFLFGEKPLTFPPVFRN